MRILTIHARVVGMSGYPDNTIFYNTNHRYCGQIIDVLVEQGVTQFCIAPGGRSGCIALAASNHRNTSIYTHFDERGASFFALGQAIASGIPSAAICTSGTAVANYLPAVVESSYQQTPLIVITADVPHELLGIGFNQAIDQRSIFDPFLRWKYDFEIPRTLTDTPLPTEILQTITDGIMHAQGPLPGPIHINIRIGSVPPTTCQPFPSSPTPPKSVAITDAPVLSIELHSSIAEVIAEASNGIIVVGKLPIYKDYNSILELASHLNWPILAEHYSSLRGLEHTLLCAHHSLFIPSLLQESTTALLPDCILHFGGDILLRPPEPPFSRSLQQYLKRASNDYQVRYFHISESSKAANPDNLVTDTLVSNIAHFCENQKKLQNTSYRPSTSSLLHTFQDLEQKVTSHITHQHESYTRLGEVSATREICAFPPSQLFVANSLPLRYLDLMLSNASSDLQHQPFSCKIASLDGVKGIDGTISAAAGFCSQTVQSTVALMGDIAFLHDINSLSLLNQLSTPLTIVVLNNDGGSIFSFVESKAYAEKETLFTIPHGFTCKAACEQFKITYKCPKNIKEFRNIYRNQLRNPSSSMLIEVCSDPSYLEQELQHYCGVSFSTIDRK